MTDGGGGGGGGGGGSGDGCTDEGGGKIMEVVVITISDWMLVGWTWW